MVACLAHLGGRRRIGRSGCGAGTQLRNVTCQSAEKSSMVMLAARTASYSLVILRLVARQRYERNRYPVHDLMARLRSRFLRPLFGGLGKRKCLVYLHVPCCECGHHSGLFAQTRETQMPPLERHRNAYKQPASSVAQPLGPDPCRDSDGRHLAGKQNLSNQTRSTGQIGVGRTLVTLPLWCRASPISGAGIRSFPCSSWTNQISSNPVAAGRFDGPAEAAGRSAPPPPI
jgi:hypothetical protein